jgi:phage gpG-like protein
MKLTFKMEGDDKLLIYLKGIEKNIEKEIRASLREAVDHLFDEVRGKFGKYNKGWAKLKRATVIAKYRRRMSKGSGMSSSKFSGVISSTAGAMADDPLILFGDLRESIERTIKGSGQNMQGVVYSDAKHAAVHEYGYAPKNIPARSYMRLTLWEEEDYIVKLVNNRIARLI